MLRIATNVSDRLEDPINRTPSPNQPVRRPGPGLAMPNQEKTDALVNYNIKSVPTYLPYLAPTGQWRQPPYSKQPMQRRRRPTNLKCPAEEREGVLTGNATWPVRTLALVLPDLPSRSHLDRGFASSYSSPYPSGSRLARCGTPCASPAPPAPPARARCPPVTTDAAAWICWLLSTEERGGTLAAAFWLLQLLWSFPPM
ncbi:hypothetical protein PG991_016184 [Apiospora marii]|uniref:Uncharacterized protein n=1 Tax=Apiospora marii TaxID=335849 RepID=A0ABR1R0Z9_9PEZI